MACEGRAGFFEQLATFSYVSEKGCRAPRVDAHYFVIGEAGGG